MQLNYLQIIKNFLGFIFDYWLIFLLIIVFFVALSIIDLLFTPKKAGYQYRLKNLIMTDSEFKFYKILCIAVTNQFDIFPQIHLDAILDNKIRGQSWIGAFRHINEKSIDFVLCDKKTGAPVLVIELDDKSHLREDRIIRDEEVERIFRDAKLPLLRIKDKYTFTPEEISNQISNISNPSK